MSDEPDSSRKRRDRSSAPEACPLCGGNGWLPRQRNLPPQFYQRCDCNPEPTHLSFGGLFMQDLAEVAAGSEEWSFHQLGAVAVETIDKLAKEGMNREMCEWVFFRFFDVMEEYRGKP